MYNSNNNNNNCNNSSSSSSSNIDESESDYYDDNDEEEDIVAPLINNNNSDNNNEQQLPFILDNNNDNIDNNNNNNNNNNKEVEDIINRKSTSLFKHKYLKDVILIYILFSLVCISSICYGLFIPNVVLNYVRIKNPSLSPDQLQSKASMIKSFLDAIPYIFMFLLGPAIGVLSDKYGRKVPLYWTACINILDIISCLISIKINNLVPLFIVHSIAGSANVTLAAMFSYLADITDQELLPTVFSMTGMAMGLGVIIGPLAFLVSNLFPKVGDLTLYISIGVCVLSMIVVFFLKESLTIAKENNKIRPSKKTSNPFKLIKRLFSSSGYVTLVIGVYTLVSFCIQDVLTTYVYSTQLRYHWTPSDTSYFMVGSGVFMLLWSILIVPTLLKYYSERKVISFALLIGCLTRISYAFAFSQYMWIVTAAFAAFLPNSISLLTSVISRSAPPEIQGSILTGVQAIGSIAGFVGALAAGNVYSFAISKRSPKFFPGAPYLLTSGVLAVAFIGTLFIWKKYSNPNPLKRRERKSKSKSKSIAIN